MIISVLQSFQNITVRSLLFICSKRTALTQSMEKKIFMKEEKKAAKKIHPRFIWFILAGVSNRPRFPLIDFYLNWVGRTACSNTQVNVIKIFTHNRNSAEKKLYRVQWQRKKIIEIGIKWR